MPNSIGRGRLVAPVGGMIAVIALVLFGAAGTTAWPAGWAFVAAFGAFTVALTAWLLRHDPGLLTERLTGAGKHDQPTWDKAFHALANVAFLAWLAVMPLDAVRFRWSRVPGWAQLAGAALLLAAFALFFLTFQANTYLSPAVRVQADRGQTVVSTGPYAYVRHPMYAAALVLFAGTTLMLGSWGGLGPTLALAVALAWRAVREERVLRAALPGYAAYLEAVRYRFFPGVW